MMKPAPELVRNLEAIAAVARAAVSIDDLQTLAARVLSQMRAALDLETAAIYLVEPGQSTFRLNGASRGDGTRSAEPVLVLDPDAVRLMGTGRPLIFRDAGTWLGANPFTPPASDWLILPLVMTGELAGIVVAASSAPIALDAVAATTFRSMGDLLSTAVATAMLRRELLRGAIERERWRLAEDLHDGLAQDLAVARREVAVLHGAIDDERRVTSLARLDAALRSANRIVRTSLEDLAVSLPVGGLAPAVHEVVERARHQGARVIRVDLALTPIPHVDPVVAAVVLRVLHEALANAIRHAPGAAVSVVLTGDSEGIRLVVADDGPGLPATAAGVGDGHFGLTIMAERARRVRGRLAVGSSPAGGTEVCLEVPADALEHRVV